MDTSSRSGATRTHQRREQFLARWRLSTVLAAVVALCAIAAVLAAGFSLGGFGVPRDSAPQQINPSNVPFGLLSKTANPPDYEHKGPLPEQLQVNLFFIGPDGRLGVLDEYASPPVTLESEVNLLLAGTGNARQANYLETAIPAGTQLLGLHVSNGLATINLGSAIESINGVQLIQAIAQLVYTVATQNTCSNGHIYNHGAAIPTTTTTKPVTGGRALFPCVNRVVIEVDGVRQAVPTSTGEATLQPLMRSDYSSLLSS